MVDTEKRNKRQNDWIKENTDRINFTMPKGTKDRIQAAADQQDIKASQFIRNAIEKALQEAEK